MNVNDNAQQFDIDQAVQENSLLAVEYTLNLSPSGLTKRNRMRGGMDVGGW